MKNNNQATNNNLFDFFYFERFEIYKIKYWNNFDEIKILIAHIEDKIEFYLIKRIWNFIIFHSYRKRLYWFCLLYFRFDEKNREYIERKNYWDMLD